MFICLRPRTPPPPLTTVYVYSAGIFKQSMGARFRVGIGLLYRPHRLHRLAELIPWNRFLISTCRGGTIVIVHRKRGIWVPSLNPTSALWTKQLLWRLQDEQNNSLFDVCSMNKTGVWRLLDEQNRASDVCSLNKTGALTSALWTKQGLFWRLPDEQNTEFAVCNCEVKAACWISSCAAPSQAHFLL